MVASMGPRPVTSTLNSKKILTREKEYYLINKNDQPSTRGVHSAVLATLAKTKVTEQVALCPYAKEIESVGL